MRKGESRIIAQIRSKKFLNTLPNISKYPALYVSCFFKIANHAPKIFFQQAVYINYPFSLLPPPTEGVGRKLPSRAGSTNGSSRNLRDRDPLPLPSQTIESERLEPGRRIPNPLDRVSPLIRGGRTRRGPRFQKFPATDSKTVQTCLT